MSVRVFAVFLLISKPPFQEAAPIAAPSRRAESRSDRGRRTGTAGTPVEDGAAVAACRRILQDRRTGRGRDVAPRLFVFPLFPH
ncbi:hypothetical protein SY94_5326 (plasmid) [Agrobacterium tumefaciens]|nr:hypothetical protein SY94_5326 [Agrobacterium tumefaciens]